MRAKRLRFRHWTARVCNLWQIISTRTSGCLNRLLSDVLEQKLIVVLILLNLENLAAQATATVVFVVQPSLVSIFLKL